MNSLSSSVRRAHLELVRDGDVPVRHEHGDGGGQDDVLRQAGVPVRRQAVLAGHGVAERVPAPLVRPRVAHHLASAGRARVVFGSAGGAAWDK